MGKNRLPNQITTVIGFHGGHTIADHIKRLRAVYDNECTLGTETLPVHGYICVACGYKANLYATAVMHYVGGKKLKQ